jgi:predicted nucleic acid-binding protein
VILIDASVAFKWFVPEEGAAEAQRLLVESDSVVAPELVIAEVGNALWKVHRRGALSAENYTIAFSDLCRSFTELLRLDELVVRASEIARELDHPIYDCFYLACAEREEAQLVTADQRLLRVLTGSVWEGICRPLGTGVS